MVLIRELTSGALGGAEVGAARFGDGVVGGGAGRAGGAGGSGRVGWTRDGLLRRRERTAERPRPQAHVETAQKSRKWLRVLGQVGRKGGLDTNAGVGKWLRVLGQVGPKGGLDTTLRTLAVGSKSIGLKRQTDWAVQT